MNASKYLLLIACFSTPILVRAAQPSNTGPTNEAPAAPSPASQPSAGQTPPAPAPNVAAVVAIAPASPAETPAATNTATSSTTGTLTNAAAVTNAGPPVSVEYGTNGLRVNFRGAPLNLVLDYLSDAAGFIINKETDVRGTVEVWSKEPLTKDEAVEVLNSVLKKNGCAVVRNGRILTIVAQDEVHHKDTPVVVNNNPGQAEGGDEVVTQIIPVRYANVTQLVPNLQQLLPTTATLSANESANSLILVATKTDIKRMLKIVDALDTSIASVASIRVIPLKYADAKDTATLITTLFTPQTGNQPGAPGGTFGRGSLFRMLSGGGFGGPGGPGGFGPPGGGSGGSGGGGAAGAKVTAVGDDRSNSLVVSAPADLMTTIENMVKEIDQEVTDVTELRVFRLVNADASEVADQLTELFPDPTTSNNNNQGPMPPFAFFRGGFGGRGGTTSAAANSSERMKKMGRVQAVPDPRTASLIVMASKTLMPQIADMITELDSNPGRKEIVGYFDIQNADVADVYNNLQDLFQRNNVRPQNNTVNPSFGQNNALYKRQTSNTQPTQQGTPTGLNGNGMGGGSGLPR
ncbi:MAG TPA: secretin N-terminal domain-containing protein [Candidatus Acidoferrum sp.]|nr:secretin N-terminal domain-containing protein [Candidatus Acidoferrum sp.]